MPRRKRVRTSRKKAFRARSKGKLFSRRGRTFRGRYVRRGRRNRFRGGRKFVRRYRSSSKFPFMRLVKHSVYLSPSDFLMFPFYDVSNFMAAAAYQIQGRVGKLWNPIQNDLLSRNNCAMNIEWLNNLAYYSRWMSMCHSTQLVNNGFHAMQQLSSSMPQIKLFSFNPPHSVATGGPYFMLYANIYQFFKFCGLKVKFIPHTRKAATTVPEYNGVITQGLNNQTLTLGYEPTGRWSTCLPIGNLDNALLEHANDDDVKTVAPPQYRLWLNFDKISPLSNYLPPWALAGSIDEVNLYATDGLLVLNNNIWTKKCLQTRLKFIDCFKQDMNFAHLRSFSLTKPFKFYVRPYDVQFTQENPVAPGIDETEVRSSALKYIIDGDGDQQQRTPKRQSWIRTPAFYPMASFAFDNTTFNVGNDWTITPVEAQGAKSSQNMIQNNLIFAANFADENYYNPPLFNYFFSRDDLEPYEGQNLLGVFESTYTDAGTYFRRYSFEGYPNFNQAGRFKLTFYYRFKRPRNEIPVSLNIPREQFRNANRGFNAGAVIVGTEAIGERKHIKSTDLPVNVDGVF